MQNIFYDRHLAWMGEGRRHTRGEGGGGWKSSKNVQIWTFSGIAFSDLMGHVGTISPSTVVSLGNKDRDRKRKKEVEK